MWTNYFGAVFFETMTLSVFLWLLGFYWYMRRENLICHIFRGGTDPRITTSRTQKKRELPAKVQDHGWKDLLIIKTWSCSVLCWAACQNDRNMIMTKILIVYSPLATRRVPVGSWSQLCSSFLTAGQNGFGQEDSHQFTSLERLLHSKLFWRGWQSQVLGLQPLLMAAA